MTRVPSRTIQRRRQVQPCGRGNSGVPSTVLLGRFRSISWLYVLRRCVVRERKVDDRGPQVPARVRDPLQLALGRRGGQDERPEVEWMGWLTRPTTAVNFPLGTRW